jgi:hypothetical protein
MAGNTAVRCTVRAAAHRTVYQSALGVQPLPRDSHRAPFPSQVLATSEEDTGYLATALVWKLGRYSNAYNIFVRGNISEGGQMVRRWQHLTGSREFPQFFHENGAIILQQDPSVHHLSSTLTLRRKEVTIHAACL